MPKKNDPQIKPHYRGLTIKEGNFVDEAVRQVLEEGTLNKTKAALKAYDTNNKVVAASMGGQNFRKQRIRRAFLTELERQGLSDKRSISAHSAALDATKRRRDYDTGEIWEEPDHATRLRAVDLYYKVKGLYPDKQTQTTKRQATLNLYANMTPQELEKVEQDIIARIKALEASTEPQKEKEKESSNASD